MRVALALSHVLIPPTVAIPPIAYYRKPMFLATVNKPRQLLLFTYIGRITLAELQRAQPDILKLLPELDPGFRLLSDYTWLDRMDLDCADAIGELMETIDRHGVGLLVRIMPDPTKDIGLTILTHLHYRNQPRVVACETMPQAAAALEL